MYVAVTLNRAESQVSAGENSGHRLTHVSVVKSLTKIGALKQGQVLAQDVQLKLEPGSDSRDLRLIAFVQEPRQGRVLGAASMLVMPSKNNHQDWSVRALNGRSAFQFCGSALTFIAR